jgi:putative PEP-CTERM system histidine kinase
MMGVFFIFAGCAAVYLGFTAVLIIRGGRKRADAYLIAAAALTGLWSAAIAFLWSSPDSEFTVLLYVARPLEVVASVVWILLILELALPKLATVGRLPRTAVMLAGSGLTAVLLSFLEVEEVLRSAGASPALSSVLFAARICLALVGLAAIENLIRNTVDGGFWSVKYLGIGLGGLFAYDFFVYADALLFRRLSAELLELRGPVLLLVLPLIVVGARRSLLPDRPIGLSHRMAFHSAAILGGGIYLLIMGGAGYYIRQFGGTFSSLFTGLFLFGALLLLAVILASGSIRAWLKVWLYKNLFLYKYDYRQEWLRFINTVATDQSGTNLRMRVIKSIANIVDSTGGALWEWQDGDQSYELTERWNYRALAHDRALDHQLVSFIAQKGWIINLNDWRTQPGSYEQMAVPDWLRDEADAWILVPLLHRSHVLGVVLLKQPRTDRLLNWEDFDLLKMCGRQVASYLSESSAVQALSAARELEIFNRRFAFVIHDIKTTISQLSLMLKNAEKHGENPAFQKDLLASVRDSVAAMSRILEQINAERKRTPAVAAVDLAGLVERVAGQRAKVGGTSIRIDCESRPLNVMGDDYRLTAIVSHLIQNAVDAAGDNGQVGLSVRRAEGMVVLDVVDNGSGMDPEFVRDHLFQPFQTTKGSGYGIGAYQCRELIRELGGRLTVRSVPGEGTTMSVVLPLAAIGSVSQMVRVE